MPLMNTDLRASALLDCDNAVASVLAFKRFLRSTDMTHLLERAGKVAAADGAARLSLSTVPQAQMLSLRLTVSGLPSFKDERLMAVLERAEKYILGKYESRNKAPDAVNPETRDYGYGKPNREYVYNMDMLWKETRIYITFTIDAFAAQDSATCRIVKKEKEIPAVKYMETIIVCD